MELTRYNYGALDKLLTEVSTPLELGNQLDEIMHELVSHASNDHGCYIRLEEHYAVLRIMRDIFWRLEVLL
jgi:hypothetical protein